MATGLNIGFGYVQFMGVTQLKQYKQLVEKYIAMNTRASTAVLHLLQNHLLKKRKAFAHKKYCWRCVANGLFL